MRAPTSLLLACLSLIVLGAPPTARAADAFSIGVIVSREGAARAAGAAQTLAATTYAARLRARGGIFGRDFELLLRDDAGDPRAAGRLARELVDQGVGAIVCCTTAAATRVVAQVADDAGVVLLAPSPLDTSHYWAFSLALSDADDLAAIVSDAHRRGVWTMALMTLDNGFGDDAATTLQGLLGYAGIGMVADVRYAPGTTDLRPEALWTATRQPGAVVVWGLKGDLLAAVDGLRRRGYTGPIYGRSALLDPVAGGLDLGRLPGVRFATAPAVLAEDGTPPGACAEEASAVLRQLRAATGGTIDVALATPVYDALDLLRRGLEQVAILPLPDDRPEVARQALRDSLVGLPPTCGGGGRYDLQEGSSEALQASSVAFSEVRGGRSRALP